MYLLEADSFLLQRENFRYSDLNKWFFTKKNGILAYVCNLVSNIFHDFRCLGNQFSGHFFCHIQIWMSLDRFFVLRNSITYASDVHILIWAKIHNVPNIMATLNWKILREMCLTIDKFYIEVAWILNQFFSFLIERENSQF